MNRADSVFIYQNYTDSALKYSQQASDLNAEDPDILQKVNELNNNISSDINDMNILVQNMSSDHPQKEEILSIVMKNLAILGGELGNITAVLDKASTNFTSLKSLIIDEVQRVDNIYRMVKVTSNSVLKVQGYMLDFQFPKTEAELKDLDQIEAANLSMQSELPSIILSEESEKPSAKDLSTKDKVFGFFSDMFPPEPKIKMKGGKSLPLNKLIGEKHVDKKETIEDYAGIMKNKAYGKMIFFKNGDQQIIADKDGNTFTAPVVFVTDISRSEQFKLNGKVLLETKYSMPVFQNPIGSEGNPNEIVKEMVKLFGPKGTELLLKLCFQGITSTSNAIMVEKSITHASPYGEYAKAISNKLHIPIKELVLMPGNDKVGMFFNIELDDKGNVSVTIKYMAIIKYMPGLTEIPDFTAHVPVKIKITMPVKSLLDEKFDEKTGKQLGIHVEETLGKLIINDRNAAYQVLEHL